MVVNPFLAEMGAHDLDRRYARTLVRYNGEIALVNAFGGPNMDITTATGTRVVKFDPMKLDISRPAPRWVVREKPWYINYLYLRQWHRGFCQDNTVIRDFAGSRLRIPCMECFGILDMLYIEVDFRLHMSSEQVLETVKKEQHIRLTPKVLIVDDKSGMPPLIFFREVCIGRFGSVDPDFEQEMKELIGDYKNADDAKPLPREERQAAKVNGRREGAAMPRLNEWEEWNEPVPDPQMVPLRRDNAQLLDDILRREGREVARHAAGLRVLQEAAQRAQRERRGN